jgi:PKD repeat protein
VGDPPSDPADPTDPTDPSPPVAITGLSVFNDGPAAVGQAVKFAAIVETGSNIRFAWNFGDGATGEGATTSHVYAGPGEYSVTMTASNSLGDVQATTKVTVQSSDPSDPSDPTDPSGPDIQIQLFTPFIVK